MKKTLFLLLLLFVSLILPAREMILPLALAPLQGNLLQMSTWDFSQQWIAGDKAKTSVRVYGDSLLAETYAGPHVFADGQLEYSAFDGGYFNADGSPCYYITDWQGNNAAVVNSAGSVIQSVAYYPYGEPTVEPKGQRYLFGGKEREHAGGRNAYDFGARSLTPFGSWPSPDPKAEDFYQISPFSYCAGDPINRIDPMGEAWYRTIESTYNPDEEEFEIKNVFKYTSAKNQIKFDEINNDTYAEYIGDIVVVFNGSYDEKLSPDGTIDGEGAVNASVTVYGPRNEADIQEYIGFTMSSDFNVFGAIDNGEYNVNYDLKGKSGSLKSHYAVNNRGPVNCLYGKNPSPPEYAPYSATQKMVFLFIQQILMAQQDIIL